MISVLYVDDEPDLVEITREFLQRTGDLEVTGALSGAEALDALQARPFDIIVSDFQMPEMDGIGLLKAVRGRYGTLPFILFTGRGREEIVIEAINNGADFYLQKGGDPSAQFAELAHKVRMAVERKKATDALIHHRERFRAVTDNMDAAIYVADMTTYEILFVNKNFREKFGDVAGKTCWQSLQEGQTGPCPFCTNEKLVDAGGNPTGIYVWEFFNPLTKRWYEIRDSAIRWTDGRLVRLGIATDITGRKEAGEALRESENKFATVFKNSPVAMTLVSLREKTFVDVNDAFVRNSGYSREETIGKTPQEIGLFADASSAEKIIRAIRGQGIVTGIEVNMRAKSNEIRTCLFSASSVMIGGEAYNLSSIEDITDMKATGQELRKSEEMFRTLVETTPDIIWEIDNRGNFLYISPSVTRVLGYSHEDYTGRSITGLVREEARQAVRERLVQFVAQEGPLPPFEIPARHRDGRNMEIEIRALSLKDAEGNTAGFRGIAIDVTERKRTVQALRESEEKYRNIVETSPDMIWEIDPKGRFRYMSPAVTPIMGYRPEDVVGRSIADLVAFEGLAVAEHYLADAATRPGLLPPFEVAARHKDGSDLVIEIRSSPLKGPDGSLAGYRGVARDITEQKRIEDALRAANRQLNLLNGITRHDILNKVAVIRGFLALVKQKTSDPQVNKTLETIAAATDDIRAEIEFTRVYENLGTHKPQWIALEAILPRSRVPAGITLHAPVAGIEILSDPMLERVFFNLLDNAIRHGGQVTEIRVTAQGEGDALLIAWEDNGCGIPAGEKEQIFERGVGKNTGLGLFLVREILSLTGITIRETGVEGKGARFEMRVPKGSYRTKNSP